MLSNFFAPLAAKIMGGVSLVLLLLLPLAYMKGRDDMHGKMQKELALCEVKHSVTRQSLDALSKDLQAMVEEGEARQTRVEELAVKAKRESDALRRDADRVRAAVVEACETPEAVIRSGL